MECTLILGATGFLGPHLVASAFVRAQQNATMADPFGPPVVAVGRDVDKAPRYTNPRDGADWMVRDLLEAGVLEDVFADARPSHVVLAAALSRGGECADDPELARASNVELARRVAELCAVAGARLVHVSTDLVFGQSKAPKGGFSEKDGVGPVSVYGTSKAEGEQAVLAAYPGALVVRLPLLYGDSGGRGLGASDGLLEAVDRDERARLFLDEFRTPLEVGNGADALIELLHGAEVGVLHLAGGQRISRFELGLEVLRAAGFGEELAGEWIDGVPSAQVDTGVLRPEDVSLDARRAQRLLDVTLLDVRAGLAKSMG